MNREQLAVTFLSEESQDRRPTGPQAGWTAASEAEVETSATERVINFSDAVVAIAITLLALALPTVDGTNGMTNGQLLHQLRGDWPHYLAFLISFAVIGIHWSTHRRVFRYANRVNRTVGRLNMVWLLMVILIPVAAQLLGGQGAFGVRFTCYALIEIIATACLMQMSRELARSGLLRRDAPERARHPDPVPLLAVCVSFLVSIPLAFATHWAFALWAAAPLTERVLRRLMAQGRHATGDATQGPANRTIH
jgi:uncharacterized membrane protein